MLRKLLALLFLLVPGVAHAEWHEASTRHFLVYSDDRADRLREFASNLERFDKALRYRFQVADEPVGPANRVTVYIVDDEREVRRLAGTRASGFYVPRASGTVAFVPRSTGGNPWDLSALEILLHEYAHHFMFSMASNQAYPRWFAEGFAEFYATAKFEKDGSVILGHPPQYRSYAVMNQAPMPVEKLLSLTALGKMTGEEINAIYGRGWLLTHYLTLGGTRAGQIGAYLAALNQGKPVEEAAKVFGDLRALDRELQAYRKGTLGAMKIGAQVLAIGEVPVRKLGPGETATMAIRMRSKRGVDDTTAPAVYEAAKKACTPFPNDLAAQLVLTEAAYDAKDYVAAEAAADRAIAADPKAVDAWLYKAMARMALAGKAGDKRPETWSAIRKLIGGANRLDPEDPEPLMLYYRSFGEAGQPPSESARKGLEYAFALAPNDRGLRMNVAQARLAAGDKAVARGLLLVLANDAHSGGFAAAAAKTIAEIDGAKLEDVPAEDGQ